VQVEIDARRVMGVDASCVLSIDAGRMMGLDASYMLCVNVSRMKGLDSELMQVSRSQLAASKSPSEGLCNGTCRRSPEHLVLRRDLRHLQLE
jgi:hypothetical protein